MSDTVNRGGVVSGVKTPRRVTRTPAQIDFITDRLELLWNPKVVDLPRLSGLSGWKLA